MFSKKDIIRGIAGAMMVCVFCAMEAQAQWLEATRQARGQWAEQGVEWEIVATEDFFVNTSGGLQRDATYLGNLDLALTLDSTKMGLWPDGTFFIYVLDNHGGDKLSGALVGDIQTISSIEAPRLTRLYEAWYEHNFLDGRLTALLGLHDFNGEFNVTEYGGLFLNGAFGISSEMAVGARPSIFPLAAPALRLKMQPDAQWQFLVGLYDGDPGDPEVNRFVPRVRFDRAGGMLLAAEVAYAYRLFPQTTGLAGQAKWGWWGNTGRFGDQVDTDALGTAIERQGNYGGYFIVDQELFQGEDGHRLSGFIQVGVAPDHINEVDLYLGGGLNFIGLWPGRRADTLGVAVAHASISDTLVDQGGRDNSETTLEVTYNYQWSDNLRLQPDIQFIFNPGADPTIKNATVVGLRMEMAL